MKLSVVTSLYDSEKVVGDFYLRHLKVIKKLNLDYEFIFVDDGSPDESCLKVEEVLEKDDRVKLIKLSRNFGQHAAMFAGLGYAKGDVIYAADCDLEEAPENLSEMYLLYTKSGSDVVYGVTEERSGDFVRSFLGKCFYDLLDFASEVKIPRNQAWQRVMSRRYLDALLSFKEVNSLPIGLMALSGFEQLSYTIEKPYKGATSYNFLKRYKLALDCLLSYSTKPLVAIVFFGFIITLISFLCAVSIVVQKTIFQNQFDIGWPSIVIVILFMGGVQLVSSGVIGLYVSKTYDQVKNRPKYIIKDVVDNS
ncbi:glycosyltransferase family 2 protein [Halobacteriovorax sp. JY17]|uniref:glycosyltransferase family 2 protein n=1 Tax=Halobacteriovorax sp. JY17 TaxID=2014617 RepID=UPI000C420ADE|nr:glycosyltransferase family 2 protein [Halobacteriovorax sp. JY17]PIK14682.1 MAG: hypothetical protein CES88_10110 [Halobacteriovorax sp. JY17]